MVRPDLASILDARLPNGVEIRSVEDQHLRAIFESGEAAFLDHGGQPNPSRRTINGSSNSSTTIRPRGRLPGPKMRSSGKFAASSPKRRTSISGANADTRNSSRRLGSGANRASPRLSSVPASASYGTVAWTRRQSESTPRTPPERSRCTRTSVSRRSSAGPHTGKQLHRASRQVTPRRLEARSFAARSYADIDDGDSRHRHSQAAMDRRALPH